jgi:hypothetical protein
MFVQPFAETQARQSVQHRVIKAHGWWKLSAFMISAIVDLHRAGEQVAAVPGPIPAKNSDIISGHWRANSEKLRISKGR